MNYKHFFVTFFFLITFSTIYAQKETKYSSILTEKLSAIGNYEELTVWIYLTDKGQNIHEKLMVARQNLSQRTLDRRYRTIKKQDVATFYDVPLAETYVSQLMPFMINMRHRSKWLNAVSANVSASNLPNIAALEFVKKIDIVRKGKKQITDAKTEAISKNGLHKSAAYSLDYGPSLDQLEQINVPFVHDLGYSGSGIVICLMDAGFRKINIHPSFDQMDILDTYDFVNGDDNVGDQPEDLGSGSHGEATLSVTGGFVEGQLIGPAYGATFLLAKTENTESETQIEEDNWVAAAEWAEAQGADITSTSLGYIFFDDETGYFPADLDGNTATITIASDILASMGVLVINSAGNSGGGMTTIGAPADGDSVLAVGAVNAAGVKAGFSSVGPTADGRIKPDVMAMGVAVVSATGDSTYSNLNGTSFSCPLTAGAAALLWEMVPSATNMEIFEALKMSADNSDNPNNEYGWGIIDIYAAYEYLVENDTEAPMAHCQNDTIALDMGGMASIEASLLDDSSSDNIGISSYLLDVDTFYCEHVGAINVNLIVSDVAGNTDSCTAILTVIDTLPPILSMATLLDVKAECEVNDLTPPIAIDNCADTLNATQDMTLPITVQGNTEIIWTFDDGNGNTTTQLQNIVIEDETAPIALAQDITIDLNGSMSVSIIPDHINDGSSDNCGIENLSLDIDIFSETGDYTVTLSVEDGNQNISTDEAIVTIIDSTVSTSEENTNNQFRIYPNPANTKVFLEFDQNKFSHVDVNIYNSTGNLVKTIEGYYTNHEIRLPSTANGLFGMEIVYNGIAFFKKFLVTQ